MMIRSIIIWYINFIIDYLFIFDSVEIQCRVPDLSENTIIKTPISLAAGRRGRKREVTKLPRDRKVPIGTTLYFVCKPGNMI